MKRAVLIALIAYVVMAVALLYSDIKDFLFWTHPWWHSFLVAIPEIALAIFAWSTNCVIPARRIALRERRRTRFAQNNRSRLKNLMTNGTSTLNRLLRTRKGK